MFIGLPIIALILYLLGWLLGTVFPVVMDFIQWWLKVEDYATEKISTAGLIIIDIISAPIVYLSVGAIFDALGWYDSKVMHYVNLGLSAIITVGMALIVRIFIDYWWAMLIAIIICLIIFVTLKITKMCKTDVD